MVYATKYKKSKVQKIFKKTSAPEVPPAIILFSLSERPSAPILSSVIQTILPLRLYHKELLRS